MKEIQLTQEKTALVDDEDYEYLNQWKWYASEENGSYYASRKVTVNGIKTRIKMHRLILGLIDRQILTDHRDRNPLNNQRSNLRIANHSENAANVNPRKNSSSKYLGVCWRANRNKWQAQIKKNDAQKYLGLFTKETDAALAYNKAAIELHGDFANINKI